jgi:aspartyl/asparaginyl beta-hydroxylase (cupin superfamily)
MYFDGSFRHIGTIDPQALVHAVESIDEQGWQEFAHRQQKFSVHRQTQTIPLLFDDDMRHTDPTAWPRLAQFESMLEPVLGQIVAANPPAADSAEDGYFVRIILTRLSPGSYITPHRDKGDSLKRSHRNHLALTTNPLVDFGIDGEIRHFAPGEIWEINNRKFHAVRNLGDQPRIHMILDYVVPGEEIHDPDGLVIG